MYMGLFPTLEVQHFPLASPPLTAGVVAAAETGYVAQKHPEGRITFVTLADGEARTLTGFELGSRRRGLDAAMRTKRPRCSPPWPRRGRRDRRLRRPVGGLGPGGRGVDAAYGLARGGASSTRPRIGSCCCCPGADQSLTIEPDQRRRGILECRARAEGGQAVRGVGGPPRAVRRRRAARATLTVIQPATTPVSLQLTLDF